MIEKLEKWKNHKFKDVYLLGAGSSLAYGYPTGSQLKINLINLENGTDNIFNQLRKNIDECKDDDLQHHLGEFSIELKSFVEKLKKSGAQSIDSFVAKNPRYLNIAKFLVSYVLINCARTAGNTVDGIFEPSVDCKPWILNYLNKRIGLDYSGYLEEPDCFITFNYDLHLEDCFTNYYSHQEIDRDLASRAKHIVRNDLPIFHVYGNLERVNAVLNALRDDTVPGFDDLILASEGINFIDRKHKDEYKVLRSILQNAERLIILGYGFDPDNNDIIFGGLKGLQEDFLTLKIISTCKGLTDAEVDKFKKMRLAETIVQHAELLSMTTEMHDKDCNQLLMDHILVRKFFNDEI